MKRSRSSEVASPATKRARTEDRPKDDIPSVEGIPKTFYLICKCSPLALVDLAEPHEVLAWDPDALVKLPLFTKTPTASHLRALLTEIDDALRANFPNDYPFPSEKTLALRQYLLGGPATVKDWDALDDKWKAYTRGQLGMIKVQPHAVILVCEDSV